jgi:hypothetical protein
MNNASELSGLVWYKTLPDDIGGSADGLYAAQGESVQVPVPAPRPQPSKDTPAQPDESEKNAESLAA